MQSLLAREGLKLAGGGAVLLIVLIGGYFLLRQLLGCRRRTLEGLPDRRACGRREPVCRYPRRRGGVIPRRVQTRRLDQQNADDSRDAEHWGYVFTDVNEYLTGEFGPAWNTLMDVAPAEPAKGNNNTEYIVTIATEQLHVTLEAQKPKAAAVAPSPTHFGIVSIGGFSLDEALHGDPARGPAGYLTHVYGGTGSAEQLIGIIGASTSLARLTNMQVKRLLLPLVRNPRGTGVKDVIYRLYLVREDATVRHRLTKITKDARYPADLQNAAQQVLDGTVDEAVLIKVGAER